MLPNKSTAFQCLLAAVAPSVPGSLLHRDVFLIFSRAEVTHCVGRSLHSFLLVPVRQGRNSKKQQRSLLGPLYSPVNNSSGLEGSDAENTLNLAVTGELCAQNLNPAGKRNVSLKSETTLSDLRTQVEAPETDGQQPDGVFLRHVKVTLKVSTYTSRTLGSWDLGTTSSGVGNTGRGPS